MLFDVLVILLILALASAVLNTSLLPAAISLAMASIIASIIFFMFGAVWVAIFELTVVAGLITVLFISAISLTRDLKENIESLKALFYFPLVLISVVALTVVGVSGLVKDLPFQELTVWSGKDEFQTLFWDERKMDILGLAAVILAGIFGIAAFFRKTLSPEAAAIGPLDIALSNDEEEQEQQEVDHA